VPTRLLPPVRLPLLRALVARAEEDLAPAFPLLAGRVDTLLRPEPFAPDLFAPDPFADLSPFFAGRLAVSRAGRC
jgi:hypothetical protein